MNTIHRALLLIVLFSISAIPFLWTTGDELLLGYDNVYPLRPVEYIQDRFYSWTRTRGVEMDHSGMQGSVIIHAIDSLPQFVGFSPHTSQKIVFSSWFFLLLMSPYLFMRRLEQLHLLKNPLVKYIFPVLYAINFYVLQAWWVAERTKFSLMVAMPIILMVVIEMVFMHYSLRFIIKKSIFAALVLTIFNGGGWIGLPLYGGLFIGLGVSFLFFFAILLHNKDFLRVRYLALFYVLFSVLFALFNAYTLIPFIFVTFQGFQSQLSTAGGVTGLLGWANYLSADTSIVHLLQMQGIPDWYNSIDTHPYASIYLRNNVMVAVSFLFPILLFLSFLSIKKQANRKIALFFMVLFIVSIIMTAGTHKPFGALVAFLFKHVPGFIIFRSIFYKFGYIYWFSASFFISLGLSSGISSIAGYIKNSRLFGATQVLLTSIVIAILVIYHVPYLTGDIFRVSQNNESGRVTVPSYIPAFAEWWREQDSTSKILLLPQLNRDWLFEQYRWGYVSLTPVLSNYATGRMIENVEHVTPQEYDLLSKLYDGINAGDGETVDKLTHMLAIQYFLVRNDFYYDFPERETDDPEMINKQLQAWGNIRLVKTFGEWDVYEYVDQRPLIYATTSARIGDGLMEKPGEIVLSANEYSENTDFISSVQFYPECVSCSAETSDTTVIIPTLRILPDSPLYELSVFKNSLGKKPALSPEDQLFRHIGDSLKYVGYIDGLLKKESEERYIHTSAEKFITSLRSANDLLQSVLEHSDNPYKTVIIAQQYIDEERTFIRHLLRSSNKQSITITLEKMMHAISATSTVLKSFYSSDDFNVKKYYSFTVVSPGDYSIALNIDSLGTISSADIDAIRVSIDNQTPVIPSGVNGKVLQFPSAPLTAGKHQLLLLISQQKSILSEPVVETISERQCFSYSAPYSDSLQYELVFQERNMFDPYFSISIDHGKGYDPRFALYLLLSAGDITFHRYIISQQTVPLDHNEDMVRISFCAPRLTQQYFHETIQNVAFRELVQPTLTLRQERTRNPIDPPTITFQEIDQTSYRVHVDRVEGPFFLVLSERYAPGWTATTGSHMTANHYANSWKIDDMETDDITIYYKPQRYFHYGLVVSIASIFMSVLFIMLTRKRHTV